MKIVLATFGSLGDVHPLNALGIELRRRGHAVIFAAMEAYREKIEMLGFEFRPMRPHFNADDRELARRVMNEKKGSEVLLKEIILPNLRPMYEDLCAAVTDADLLISSEVVFVAASVVEKLKIKWITTTLAPGPLLSVYDPFVPPTAQWLKHFRFLGSRFHGALFGFVRRAIDSWFAPYREFRREIGLDENHNPLFEGKSDLLNLALFSKVLGKPQPDWHRPTLQCGFCFYDGQDDLGAMPAGLNEFLAAGDAPIVFTLGSAAVLDARDFFEESARAARILNRRAVLLYGMENQPPSIVQNAKCKMQNLVIQDQNPKSKIQNLKSDDGKIAAFPYAPYSKIFPRAAVVAHQGGVGTTAQVLRAGVPHLIMPYSHDQPDNAARVERLGAARIISRADYTAENAARHLRKLLSDAKYKSKAAAARAIVESEHGTQTACDAIEEISGAK
ncbi:MAG: glycosyltransferase [Pyrinomonadaceae bacterium]